LTHDARQLPLTGVRIVDVTHDWAGPHATRLLADFGAEVVKVEYARRMDGMRGAKLEREAYNHHPRWWEINRNKLSITLDLKKPPHVAIFKDLVRVSEVVVESSRVGVMETFGLGYEALRAVKPDVIYLSMSGFGRLGPDASYAGYGGCLEPLSGIQWLTSYDHKSRSVRVREVDVTNGIVGACAIMTALVHRQRTGKGQWVDLSQLEACTSALIGEHLLEFVMTGTVSLPIGNRHRDYAPQGCYPCQGEDKWVALTIRSDTEWMLLCNVMGRADLESDTRFSTKAGRAEHHDELDRAIASWTNNRTPREVMELSQRAGIAAGAVLTVDEINCDPHLAARAFFQEAEDSSGRFPGMPFRLSGSRGVVRRRGPFLGEHNAYVIGELLGRSREQVDDVTPDRVGTAFDVE
jgi:crotonobetainyl-CoA:carnitine CoA-transferase CaiB-like acyl-CoA transferase